VVIGGGDTMAGLVGTGAVQKGVSTVIGGTHWQHTYLSDRPVNDPQSRVRVSPHMVQNLWMLETNSVFIGLTMRWFRDAFCDAEKRVAKDMGVDTYYLMERIAEKAPAGSNSLIAIFGNLFNAEKWGQAASAFIQFNVLTPERFGKKEFIRRIEEDAAFQSLGNLKNIWDAAGVRKDDFPQIVFAGGASKGFLWPQILADVLGLAVRVPIVKEATALGTAICAGVGVGIFNSVSEGAEKLIKWEKTFTPEMRNHEIYMQLYDQWREVYQHFLEMTEKGIVEPLWRVPGT